MLLLSNYSIYLDLLKRIVKQYIPKYKRMLVIACVCMTVSALSTAFLAKCLKPIFDEIFINHNRDMLYVLSFSVLVIFILKGVSEFGQSVTADYIGTKIITSTQQMLFNHIISLDIAFFHKNNSSKLLSILMSDVNILKESIVQVFTDIVKNLISIVILVSLMIYTDWYLSFLSFVCLPIMYLPMLHCTKLLRKVSKQSQEIVTDICNTFIQIFQGIFLVKISMTEKQETNKLSEKMSIYFKKTFYASKIKNVIHPMMDVLTGLAIMSVIIYGGNQIISGNKTTGDIISFITFLILLYKPLKSILQLGNQLNLGSAAAERISSILSQKAPIENILYKEEKTYNNLFKKNIVLKNIFFKYSDEYNNIFNNLSCEFECGKRLAIVGHSGAGKTSLFYLLLRFYKQQSGNIVIDDKNIDNIDTHELRRNISLVSQHITLFNDTIFNNIAYGCNNITIDDVKRAAEAAFADEFINKMPNKYDTMIGENGLLLSGGQRQRIALARAFLKQSSLLLLDEATSALDNNSERIVQNAIFNVTKDKTAIIIAHRISTIESADKIYVMHNGVIIEQGTHSELIKQSGNYKKISGVE